MDALQKDLQELKDILKSGRKSKESEFRSKVDEINRKYPTSEDGDRIADFVLECYSEIGREVSHIGEQVNELTVRQQLEGISSFLSLSYIAKNYFGKSKQWLNNKMNGCMVNGKPCRFTQEEKDTLNFALSDLQKKIGSVHIV